MYNLYRIPEASTELGWAIGLPLLLMAVLFALAVPIGGALGLAAIALLLPTWVSPLTPFGVAFGSVFAAAVVAARPLPDGANSPAFFARASSSDLSVKRRPMSSR